MIKKLIPILALFVVFAIPAHGQSWDTGACGSNNVSTGNTVSCSATTGITAGDGDAVTIIWCANSACTASTSTDSATVSDTVSTFTCPAGLKLSTGVGGNFIGMQTCYTCNIIGSGTHNYTATITPGAGNTTNYAAIVVGEMTGQSTSSCIDTPTINTGTGTTTTPSLSTSAATTNATEAVWAAGITWTGTMGVSSPFAVWKAQNTLVAAYKNAVSSATQTVNWTGASTAGTWMSIVAFGSFSAPPSNVRRRGAVIQ